MNKPTDEQREVIRRTSGHLMVVAGAGSGKTATVSRRIEHGAAVGAWTVKNHLALTFTKAAATELRARLGSRHSDAKVSTIHSWVWGALGRILGEHHPRRVSRPEALLAPVLADLGLGRDVASGVIAEAAWAASIGLSPAGYVNAAASRMLPQGVSVARMAAALDGYARAKRARNMVDYGDSLVMLAWLVREPGMTARVVNGVGAVTIDEAQDLSPMQWQALSPLVERASSVCLVGDPEQAIYGFAGATPEVMLGFDAPRLLLTRSFRCSAEILATAETLRADGLQLVSSRHGLPPRVIPCASDADEVAAVVRGLSCVSDGSAAVLTRTRARRDVLARALQEDGRDGVEVLTIHEAKGREWDVVWLASCAEGVLPSRQVTNPEELEEERRLTYVAMTRARRELVISHAGIASRYLAGIHG